MSTETWASEAIAEVDLVVCDVCHTLYRLNTTADFLHFVTGETSPIRHQVVRALQWRGSPLMVAAYVMGRIVERDIGRDLQLQMLRGMEEECLAEMGERWLKMRGEPHLRGEVAGLLEKAMASGVQVVLASASIDPVIDAVAERWGVEAVSSRLSYREGRCLGSLAVDMTGQKGAHLERYMEEKGALMVVSDNESDASLMHRAEVPVVVRRREGQSLERWRDLMGERVFRVIG